MNILGISAFYHDSAAALLKNGKIVAAAQEERFTRKKHDPSFPQHAINFCLQYGDLSMANLDAVVFYEKPFLKFERLLETYYTFAPRGFKSFLSSIPVWVKEKLFLRKLIREEIDKIEPSSGKNIKFLFTYHHLSHAASAFFPSPYSESAILTIDGVGEWATASIGFGKDHNIILLKEMKFPHSVGLLYSAFTYYLGFRVNSGEYKLMGLAPYGDPTSGRVKQYVSVIYDHLLDIKEDGSIWLNQDYFDYTTGLRMVKDDVWERLFGLKRRSPESEIDQCHCDLALAIQHVTEEIVFRMARTAKKLTDAKNLCLAGGVALNCVANGKLMKAGIFDDIWIQPAAGDAGGALGAAYVAHHIYFGNERAADGLADKIGGAYLGPDFSHLDIGMMTRRLKAVCQHYNNYDTLCRVVADYLAQGNVHWLVPGPDGVGPQGSW